MYLKVNIFSFVIPSGNKSSFLFPRTYMFTSSTLLAKEQMGDEEVEVLNAVEDKHGGVIVNIEEPMDSIVFASLLKASLSHWRVQVKFHTSNTFFHIA